jgi:hypothetical protein
VVVVDAARRGGKDAVDAAGGAETLGTAGEDAVGKDAVDARGRIIGAEGTAVVVISRVRRDIGTSTRNRAGGTAAMGVATTPDATTRTGRIVVDSLMTMTMTTTTTTGC